MNEISAAVITYIQRGRSLFFFLRDERRAEVFFFRPPFLCMGSLAFAIMSYDSIT
jgi:hypothetical protein